MENHHVPGEEQKITEHHHEKSGIKMFLKKTYARMEDFSYLEMAGMAAIAILIITSTFEFQVTVKRKPWLNKVLGVKPAQQTAVTTQTLAQTSTAPAAAPIDKDMEEKVLPSAGLELPVVWGDLGKQLVKEGVIDQQKIEALYAQRGGMPADMKKMLTESNNGKIKFTAQNSSGLLNILWAFGLGQKNEILDKGEMWDKQYGGDAGKFASTGGWTLASGTAMEHYSKHRFITLTAEQQAIVDKVSRGIFRPCCGNSTHFPDCNHGMAMLGLLELMASQGVNEQDMYKYALTVNSYWFPDTYLTIAKYKKSQGVDWKQVNPQEVLGAAFSSAQGYQQIRSQVEPVAPKGGGGCGV